MHLKPKKTMARRNPVLCSRGKTKTIPIPNTEQRTYHSSRK
jgi:hypothetical protein